MGDSVSESRHLLVSQRLRERRRVLGLTQKQVVTRLSRLGVTTTNKTLSCQEHGAGVDVARLPDLARALDCTTTYLLGLTDDPHRWEPDAVDTAPRFDSAGGASGAGGTTPRRVTGAARGNWILGPVVPHQPTNGRRTSA